MLRNWYVFLYSQELVVDIDDKNVINFILGVFQGLTFSQYYYAAAK